MPPKKLNYVRVADLASGTKIEAVYLLQNFQVRPKKDGSSFVTMVLRDASGKITGVMWDNFDSLTAGLIRENDFVEAAGDVLTYNGQLQFKVSRLSKVEDDQVDGSRFLPVTPVPMAELDAALRGIIESIEDQDLRRLIDAVFGKREFMERFRRAPSAVSMHQAYIGGLMEHTICVVRNASKIADNYPKVNRSLLATAALLHDVGKVMEFVYDKKIAYSDVGRLLGHISMGYSMVELECSRIPDFPLAKKVLVQHIILSHHGLLEYGSPKRPKTVEALIVHHADQLDAQVSNYMEFATASERTGVRWEYSNMFDRYIFSGYGDDVVDGSELVRQLSYARGPLGGDEDSAGEDSAPAISADVLLRKFGAKP